MHGYTKHGYICIHDYNTLGENLNTQMQLREWLADSLRSH